MKKIELLIFVVSLLTFGCRQTGNPENIKTADSIINENNLTEDQINVTDSLDYGENGKDFADFEMVFEYIDKEINLKQKLGVRWVTNDSIEFRLFTEDDLCDTDYWGNAKNNFPESDPETDEDENGIAYPSEEYIVNNMDYSMQIRIALDKDKARIIYKDRTDIDTDCIPSSNLLLVKKNAR